MNHLHPPQPVLSVAAITKPFDTTTPPVTVLNGITMDVAPGEFLVIMGASGAGKSVLLYTMSGLDQPTTGTVTFETQRLDTLKNHQLSTLRLHRMGFIFQHPHFLEALTIRDNILLPALKAATNQQHAVTHVDDLMTRFNIDHVAHHRIGQVSGGQLQRAAICRALATRPRIVFADEPTGALNRRMTQEVLDTLTQAHQLGVSIVMVTHDPTCAARADRVAYLRDGAIVAQLAQTRWDGLHTAAREANLKSWLTTQGF